MSRQGRQGTVLTILFVFGLSLIAFVAEDLLTLLFGRNAQSTIVAVDQPRRNRTLKVQVQENGAAPAQYAIYIPRESTGYQAGQALDVRVGFTDTALRDHPSAWNRPKWCLGIGLACLLPGAWMFYRRRAKRKA